MLTVQARTSLFPTHAETDTLLKDSCYPRQQGGRTMASTPSREGITKTSFPFREGDCTFEEFLDEIDDSLKADLLEGVIYMASPDNTDPADLSTWLTVVYGGFVGAKDLGKVYHSRVAYRIGLKRGPEPDLGFVSKE